MAKYRITEEQLQKIFENMESKKISEIDTNIPSGSDTDDAPWNDSDKNKIIGNRVSGEFKLLAVESGEYLILNNQKKQLLYTIDEIWDEQIDQDWLDIKDRLFDYLDVDSEFDQDENGRVKSSNWKDYITDDNIGLALASYLNDNINDAQNLITDTDGFNMGGGEFLLITNDNVDEINNDNLRNKAKDFLLK